MAERVGKTKTGRRQLTRAVIRVLLIALVMALFSVGLRLALGTPAPFYTVVSGSMRPNLQVGDIIIVQDSNTFQNVVKGDIIVFDSPVQPGVVIVHRVHDIDQQDGNRALVTKGDASPWPDQWTITEGNYIGKVVTRAPYLGVIGVWLNPPINYLLIAVILALIFITELHSRAEAAQAP